MDALSISLFGTIFLAIALITYTSVFHLLLLFENKNFYKRNKTKTQKLSLIIPAYNESENILSALSRLTKINYPKKNLEVIVVDDGSQDNTYEIAKEFAKNHNFIKVYKKKHSGKASSINFGIRKARHELVGVMDVDSFLSKNALINCIKYFDEDRVAAVTTRDLVKNKKNILERWQDIEFKLIAFSRKIKEKLNLIDATPGPLSIYKKSVLKKVGFFDEKNLLEDVEIAWRILSAGYKIKMAYDAKVYNFYPRSFSLWLKQRTRWHIGWLQTIFKYMPYIFRKPPLGTFVLPFALFTAVLQVIIVILAFYYLINYLIYLYNYAYNSILLGLSFKIFEFSFHLNIFNYFGILLLTLSLIITYLGIKGYRKKPSLLDFITFIFLYATVFFPIIILNSFIRIISNKYSWMTK